MASSKKSVYIETTIPSLITARPSRSTFMRKMKLEEAENG
jgi:hypothetical protein